MDSDGVMGKPSQDKTAKSKTKGAKKKRGRRDTIKGWPTANKDVPAEEPSKPSAKRKTPKRTTTTKKKKKKKKKSEQASSPTGLPPKTLFLTDDEGEIAGMLPKHTLVLVNRGIVRRHGSNEVLGVDPRPTQKAFMWLIGRRPGEGLDASLPHQRPALRLVEFLVRASIVDDPAVHAAIDELYYVLCETGADIPREAPEPLSMSELPGQSHDDE